MEQRYQAVLAVIRDGVPIVQVAVRFDVPRQAVHGWLRRYEAEGPAPSPRPASEPTRSRRESARRPLARCCSASASYGTNVALRAGAAPGTEGDLANDVRASVAPGFVETEELPIRETSARPWTGCDRKLWPALPTQRLPSCAGTSSDSAIAVAHAPGARAAVSPGSPERRGHRGESGGVSSVRVRGGRAIQPTKDLRSSRAQARPEYDSLQGRLGTRVTSCRRPHSKRRRTCSLGRRR